MIIKKTYPVCISKKIVFHEHIWNKKNITQCMILWATSLFFQISKRANMKYIQMHFAMIYKKLGLHLTLPVEQQKSSSCYIKIYWNILLLNKLTCFLHLAYKANLRSFYFCILIIYIAILTIHDKTHKIIWLYWVYYEEQFKGADIKIKSHYRGHKNLWLGLSWWGIKQN